MSFARCRAKRWPSDSYTPTTSGFDFDGVDFGLGARFLDTHGTPFVGQIDDVSFYSEPLTTSEILQLASGASVIPQLTPEPGSVLLFAFAVGAVGILTWVRRRQ